MVVPVMSSTERDRELVANLAPQRAGLGEPKVVGVGGTSAANQTGLRCYEFEVAFIAMPTRLADRELAFLDLCGSRIGLMRRRYRQDFIVGWLRRCRQHGRLRRCGFDLPWTSPCGLWLDGSH
jgi:hypothetical protein